MDAWDLLKASDKSKYSLGRLVVELESVTVTLLNGTGKTVNTQVQWQFLPH